MRLHEFRATFMKQLGTIDPGAAIWRYLPFGRFASLVEFGALWFSKLQKFEDREEGVTPAFTRAKLKQQHQRMEDWFPDEGRKRQVRRFVEDCEESGRELIVANCWFIADTESQRMWDEFGDGAGGVVVKSTVGALARSLKLFSDHSWIGKVEYIDPAKYDGMDTYEGSQAYLRAFLKNAKYVHESELRVVTMNFVTPGCLNPDGSPPNDRQLSGYVYSPDRFGIYIEADLATLIVEVRTNPSANENHRSRVEALLRTAKCASPVRRSALANAASARLRS